MITPVLALSAIAFKEIAEVANRTVNAILLNFIHHFLYILVFTDIEIGYLIKEYPYSRIPIKNINIHIGILSIEFN